MYYFQILHLQIDYSFPRECKYQGINNTIKALLLFPTVVVHPITFFRFHAKPLQNYY